MTEQQLNDVWTYDQSEQTPTAVIKDSEGFDVGYVRGTGLDPRESAEKLAWRIVADHNLNLLAMAAPAVQPTTDVPALEMRVDGKESVIDSPLAACHAGRPAMTTPWIPCDCCDDFVCTVHEQHAWECACPPIDVWVEAGRDPYLDDVTPELKAWVEDNPIEEED